eukprot:scaffold165730_cov17-Prasinocladus_malaysianus.AAC.1
MDTHRRRTPKNLQCIDNRRLSFLELQICYGGAYASPAQWSLHLPLTRPLAVATRTVVMEFVPQFYAVDSGIHVRVSVEAASASSTLDTQSLAFLLNERCRWDGVWRLSSHARRRV